METEIIPSEITHTNVSMITYVKVCGDTTTVYCLGKISVRYKTDTLCDVIKSLLKRNYIKLTKSSEKNKCKNYILINPGYLTSVNKFKNGCVVGRMMDGSDLTLTEYYSDHFAKILRDGGFITTMENGPVAD